MWEWLLAFVMAISSLGPRGLCPPPDWLLLSPGNNCIHSPGAPIIMGHHEQQGLRRGALNELGHWLRVICRVKVRQ